MKISQSNIKKNWNEKSEVKNLPMDYARERMVEEYQYHTENMHRPTEGQHRLIERL